MPVGKYYKGRGADVLSGMKARYGAGKGERVFYATANKRPAMKPPKALTTKRKRR